MSTQRKDFLIVGGFAALFLLLLIFSRERPLSDRELGAKWCHARGLAIAYTVDGFTKRPPYHTGEFIKRVKLSIICKKKDLH